MPVFWGIFNLPYYALWGQVPNSMLTHHNCSSIGYWFKDWLLPLQWDLMLHKEQRQSWTAWIMQCTGMPDVSVRMGYVPGLCSAAVTNNPQMSGCHLSFNICVCVRVCVCVCVCPLPLCQGLCSLRAFRWWSCHHLDPSQLPCWISGSVTDMYSITGINWLHGKLSNLKLLLEWCKVLNVSRIVLYWGAGKSWKFGYIFKYT